MKDPRLYGLIGAVVVVFISYLILNILKPQRNRRVLNKPTKSPQILTAAPTTYAPIIEAPTTYAPITGAPATTIPLTEAPVTTIPMTAAPTTGTPVTTTVVTVPPQMTPMVTRVPAEKIVTNYPVEANALDELDEQQFEQGLIVKKNKKSKFQVVEGISNKKDDFFGTDINGSPIDIGYEYKPELFNKIMFSQEIKTFNPNFTNIMSMVPDLYKNNAQTANKASYEPVLLNDVDGSYFNKDVINLNEESQYINDIFGSISNDDDNQYFEGNYQSVVSKDDQLNHFMDRGV